MRHGIAILWALCFTLVVGLNGCSAKPSNRKATVKVTGEVYVDGQPAAELAIQFEPAGPIDPTAHTISQATTGPDGKFSVSTYEAGDGAPEGDYRLTFVWGQLNKLSMQFEGDKLNGKYNDAGNSAYNIKVEKDKPKDLGRIQLKSN